MKQRNNILEMVRPAILQLAPFHRFRHPPLLARVLRPEERILIPREYSFVTSSQVLAR